LLAAVSAANLLGFASAVVDDEEEKEEEEEEETGE
jgi:hypothetical protein